MVALLIRAFDHRDRAILLIMTQITNAQTPSEFTVLERFTLSTIRHLPRRYLQLANEVVSTMAVVAPEEKADPNKFRSCIQRLMERGVIQCVSLEQVDSIRRRTLRSPATMPSDYHLPSFGVVEFTLDGGYLADRRLLHDENINTSLIEFGWTENVASDYDDDGANREMVVIATSDDWARRQIATVCDVIAVERLGESGFIREKWWQERRQGVVFAVHFKERFPSDEHLENEITAAMTLITEGNSGAWKRLNGRLHHSQGKYNRYFRSVAMSKWPHATAGNWKELFSNWLDEVKPR